VDGILVNLASLADIIVDSIQKISDCLDKKIRLISPKFLLEP